MSGQFENVTPDTVPNLYAAHCLSNRRWEDRFVQYRNIGALLAERAAAAPDKNWLTYYDDSGLAATYTYAEFDGLARKVAAMLAGPLGIKVGDRIATLMVNDARTVLVYFGAWLIGATVVPVNCGEDEDRIAYILQNSEARVVFAMEDQVERCGSLRALTPGVHAWVQVGGEANEGFLSFDKALNEQKPLEELPDLGPETECLIVYTSGTTGAPKGVVLEQYNLLADAYSITEWHRFTPQDRAMIVLPIHHVNGMIVTLMTPLYFGGSVVLNRRFRASSFWQVLAHERCTWVSVVPTILAFLCEAKQDLSDYDLSQFRHFICGAGPLTVELARRFDEAFGKRVVHGYGLSETTCYSCFLPVDLDRDAYHHWMMECGFPSIGCPVSVNEMAIHDAEGHTLPEDVRGEIVIRGHNVMKYYFKRPDANKDTFAHGWFRSGDEGFYRAGPDGLLYFFITGRIKELIIRGGINYSPFDIDEVLNAIPGVKAAMAVGFENSFYGEEVGAYVQLEEGTQVTAEQIIAACRADLPYSKSPKVVLFGDTFPVTSTGKYQRNKLKPLFAEWKESQFREAKGAK
jgi:long-chain acyl-CoA synthetase